MNALEILKSARAILSNPDHWIKDDMAKDKNRKSVETSDPEACSFCTLGALRRAAGITFRNSNAYTDARVAIREELPNNTVSIACYNDRVSTTHADVLGLFDRAISKMENTQ